MSVPSYDWLELHCSTEEISESGWAALLIDLLAKLDGVLCGAARLRVLQVKEKFGALRFYHRLAGATPTQTEQVAELVRLACDASENVCFKCGEPGSITNLDGWIVPVCDHHASRDAFE